MLPVVPETVSSDPMVERFTRVLERFNARVTELARNFTAGDITLADWRAFMVRELQLLHGLAWQFAQAEPLAPNSTQQAWIEERVAAQLLYLDKWTRAMELIERARLNAAQIATRATLYGGAAYETLWRAYASRMGVPGLPAVPGSGGGNTSCGTACRCRLEIRPVGDETHIFWRLSTHPGAEHCGGCIEFARTWNPLRVKDGLWLSSDGSGALPNV